MSTSITPLTPIEVARWRRHGFSASDADKWWRALHDELGPPGAKWHLLPREAPSECAMSWAISWTSLGISINAAKPWIPLVPVPYGGAEVAAHWIAGGWGDPEYPKRKPSAVKAWDNVTDDPAAAGDFADGDWTPTAAAPYIAAGVSAAEAATGTWTPESLALIAGLKK